jgi:nucleoside-triphosphatase THEP1
MNNQKSIPDNSLLYYRFIALWVLNEVMFGGIIHGLKIPVSGLVVGSCAIVCICLIAWYVPKKGAIIKATIIVAIFKMALSPQAPPPAYIAVFFQGLMGELLFWNRRFFKLSCLLLAVFALVESGLQRILVLTIVYGNDLWKVINDSINGLTRQKTTVNYSLLIGSGYVLLHFIAGLLVGWWASVLPSKIAKWGKEEKNKIVLSNEVVANISMPSKRRKRLKKGLLVVWIILVLLYIQSYFKIGDPLLPSHISLQILLRSLIIVLSWLFIIGPLLKQLLHYWLQKKKSKSQQDVQQVLQLLPATQQLITASWKHSSGQKGWKRVIDCSKIILVNALNPVVAGRFFILTGPVQTGKTTSLVKWSEKRDDVFGILTPVVNALPAGSSVQGKRTFMDAHARHLFDMEATENEKERLFVGRFIFSKISFDKAIQVIRNAKDKNGWLVIDEIGPMELRGDGFREVLKEVIASGNEKQKIVLVVREGLVDEVKESFQIKEAVVINRVSDLV